MLERAQQLCRNVIQTSHYVCKATVSNERELLVFRMKDDDENDMKKMWTKHKNTLCNRLLSATVENQLNSYNDQKNDF